ncbi:MAG: hypothetical protein ACLR0U_12655 [Enterocloster clostridioformis]
MPQSILPAWRFTRGICSRQMMVCLSRYRIPGSVINGAGSLMAVTTPRFFAPAGRYEWLNYGAYVGALFGRSVKDGVGGVDIVIYRML